MPGPAWSFITDNETFSRARFRGVTWSKLASNSQSYDWSRRRSLVDTWTFRKTKLTPQEDFVGATPVVFSPSFCEDDPYPFVTNVYCTPRTTALHVQTSYLVAGTGDDMMIAQRVGCRVLKPDRWDAFPMPAGVPSRDQRGVGLDSWQLSEMKVHFLGLDPADMPGHPDGGPLDEQRAAGTIRFLPFDYAKLGLAPAADNIFSIREPRFWMLIQPDPMVVKINGDWNVLDQLRQARKDLGTELQIRIMKRIRWTTVNNVISSDAVLVGVKVHGLREEV